jgi:ring-1,2-phenylacetyl-CoA epoxidase subunit PaaC
MFQATDYEQNAAKEGYGADLQVIKNNWENKIKTVFEQATLPLPAEIWMHRGGKEGRHTEHLGFILGEMQFLQRANPGAEW